VRARHGFFTDAFAALYRDDAGRRVVVYGATGLRLTPRDDLTQETARYPDRYGVESLAAVDTGAPGVHVSCGAGRVDGTRVTVCGWADHGSVATVVFHRRSADDAAQLVNRIRTAVLSRGDWTDVSVSGR
jgi:hypothetical protein